MIINNKLGHWNNIKSVNGQIIEPYDDQREWQQGEKEMKLNFCSNEMLSHEHYITLHNETKD